MSNDKIFSKEQLQQRVAGSLANSKENNKLCTGTYTSNVELYYTI